MIAKVGKCLLLFLFFYAAVLVTYRYGLYDIPRRDHLAYLGERAPLDSSWDWFWHSVSYNRTRFTYPGDYFLFRPFHMAMLAVKDIFFRDQLFILGAINAIGLAFACTGLFIFARGLVGFSLAIVFTFPFLMQYAGVEAVIWGHINPYLYSFGFFAIAAALFNDSHVLSDKRVITLFIVLMVVGSYFHEIILLVLALTVAELFIFTYADRSSALAHPKAKKALLWIIAAPLLISLAINYIDFLFYHTPSVLGPADSAKLPTFDHLLIPFKMFAAASIVFLAPWHVSMIPKNELIYTLKWNFMAIPMYSAVLVSVVTASVCIYLLVDSIKQIRAGKRLGYNLTVILFLNMLAALIIGVGVGRGYLRGANYINSATWYWAFSDFIFSALLVLFIHRLSGFWKKKWHSTCLNLSVVGFMIFPVVTDYKQIQIILLHSYNERKNVAQKLEALANQLSESDGYCFAGALPDSQPYFANSLILNKGQLRDHYCGIGKSSKGKVPVYLFYDTDSKEEWFVTMKRRPIDIGNASSVVFQFGNKKMFQKNVSGFTSVHQRDTHFEERLLLTGKEYGLCDFGVTVEEPFSSGVVFGHDGDESFMLFSVGPTRAFGRIYHDGRISSETTQNTLPLLPNPYRLEVRYVKDSAWLFIDDYLLTAIPGVSSTSGRMGLYAARNGRDKRQSFTDMVVSNDCEKVKGDNIIIEKVFRASLP